MALATPTSTAPTLVQRPLQVRNAHTHTLLAQSDPTTTYAATDHMLCGWAEKITVQFNFVKTDGTSFEWYYEWSSDATTWYRSINLSASAGVNTVTANNQTFVAATAALEDCMYVQDLYFRVKIQRTGGAVTNTVKVTATLLAL